MNKRYFAKRGKNVDFGSLIRNVPGGITLMDDIETDVKPIDFQDVTSSSYKEAELLNADMDELLGNFNTQALTPQVMNNAPGKTMQLLAGATNGLVEYLLRTYTETFVEMVLRKLVQLEQHYETDQVIMGLAAQQAKLLQKYGMDRVTDDLLNQELSVKVNVGMGATDPQMKVQKFIGIVTAYANIMKEPVPGLNKQEVGKELFGMAGYQDGARFLAPEQDPEKLQMQKQIHDLMQMVAPLKLQVKNKSDEIAQRREKTQQDNQTKLAVAGIKEHHQNKRTLVDHISTMEQLGAQQAHQARTQEAQAGFDAQAMEQKANQPAPKAVQ